MSYVRLKEICSRLESILCQAGEHFLSNWRTFRFRLEDILFQIERFSVCYWRRCIHCDILLAADEFHSLSGKKDFVWGGDSCLLLETLVLLLKINLLFVTVCSGRVAKLDICLLGYIFIYMWGVGGGGGGHFVWEAGRDIISPEGIQLWLLFQRSNSKWNRVIPAK
jgi:hypothetical protein